MTKKEQTIEMLKRYGWQRIASDAHAHQLIRRELKHYAKMAQRDGAFVGHYQTQYLLDIKPGNWFTFRKHSRFSSILLWRFNR